MAIMRYPVPCHILKVHDGDVDVRFGFDAKAIAVILSPDDDPHGQRQFAVTSNHRAACLRAFTVATPAQLVGKPCEMVVEPDHAAKFWSDSLSWPKKIFGFRPRGGRLLFGIVKVTDLRKIGIL